MDATPTLEVGFAIDTGGSFEQLVQLQQVMDSAEAKIVADAASIEKATGSMLNLGAATASMKSFGNAATKEAQTAARELSRVEKAGEALSRQLERDAATFGKTRDELRQMKVEAAALAAEQAGLTELATRLRAQEQALWDQKFAATRKARFEAEAAAEEEMRAADRAAAARLAEANAAERAAREHAALAAQVRASHAAQVADAEAAERLRMSTDPLYAATKRLNDEIAESTRLYYAGVTAKGEYERQQAVLSGRVAALTAAHDAQAASMRRGTSTMTQFSFQLNDVITMAASGAPVLQIVATQAGQIFQVAQMAEGGVKGFAAELGGLVVRFAPLLAVLAAAAGGFALFNRAITSDVDTKPMIDSLGLTRAEVKRLKDTTVGAGDVMTATFQVLAQRVGIDMSNMSKWFGDALDSMTEKGRHFLAKTYAEFVGTFRALSVISQGLYDGKGFDAILADIDKGYADAFTEADGALKRFGADVEKQAKSNKLAELRKQAEEIKADRTPKTDRRAEQLAREARAVEAQIRNLYALADAYGVSGAAALIAEARVKAESEAIKKRGDIEAFVSRQVALAIAQRVSDAAKATASLREQAEAQEYVNGMVTDGLIPAAQAAQYLKEEIADLPLLAALQAAQQRGLATEAARAAAALAEQRKERERLRDAEEAAQFNTDMATGTNRLAELREELRLVGATDAVRARALATLRATQEAEAKFTDPARRADYIAQQVEIADQTQALADAQRDYNDALAFTAEKWDLIAGNVSNAARGIADAFGSAGQAIGDMASIYADFRAQEERARTIRDANLKNATTEAQRQREMAKYQLATATAQVGVYGDMTAAAKGFFKEGSDGYKALQKAEQVFRAVEFALSVRAMAQDAAETASSIAKSGARAAAHAVEAVARAIASMPFPLNLVAGAATAAALASIGIAIVGAFGGGSKKPTYNTGTGTVLGDGKAQSESLKNAIDQLRQVDTLTMRYSSQMLASLRNIEANIGGLASLIVRTGGVEASGMDVKTGTKLDGLMGAQFSLLSKIPVIGGLLGGIGKALFGTKTSIVGQGITADAQTLAQILGGGFDADYFTDVQKKKKLFGITTSTKYRTQLSDADAELERQFGLIFGDFYTAITAAAGPLGASLTDIQAKLSGFVVDIGKIDLKGLSGEEIQEKLAAVFGAVGDKMAATAFPGLEKFQAVGEGLLETLIRVASTVEAVNTSFALLGRSALGMDTAMALADQFDSLSDLNNAVGAYFEAYYSKEEQTAAKTAQLARVFDRLGLSMPATLSGFRALVEAQDLTTEAGQATYATLLQLAPAFADLQAAMTGARSAADILAERQELERKLLEVRGDTAALRALELAKLDESNRALQLQIWAIQDAQEAAKAADELRQAWASVGDSIMAEVKRIRGLSDTGGNSFAALQGQFNAATAAARGGDMDAAKSLPQLSQALLKAAEDAARSRQELDRVRAMTAASLEATYGLIGALATGTPPTTDMLSAGQASQVATTANDNPTNPLSLQIEDLRAEIAQLRADTNAGNAAIASASNKTAQILDRATQQSGGDALSVVQAA